MDRPDRDVDPSAHPAGAVDAPSRVNDRDTDMAGEAGEPDEPD